MTNKKTLFTSRFIQIVLFIIALLSWFESSSIGRLIETITKQSNYGISQEGLVKDVEVAISTGFSGGAIAMGLITSTCIISIVLLEINNQRK